MRRLFLFSLLIGIGVVIAAPARADSVHPLPRYTDPVRLALSGDGSVWMTGEDGGVTRLGVNGETKTFLAREDESADDVAADPDGSIWVAEGAEVVRIAPTGEVTRRPMDGRVDAITSAGGAVWVATEGGSGRIANLTGRRFVVPLPRRAWAFGGIAGAADGSVWFTEGGLGKGWIGRITTDGRYSRWPVPASIGDAGRIAAGPDGAMWFTGTHALGRIDAGGRITTVPLAGYSAPHDITAGQDGSLWFTSDICVGRVAPAGQVTTWPVPGALKLQGVAAAPDGSLWLADRVANAVRRFTPSTPAPCAAPTLTRHADATAATVSFERTDRFSGIDYFRDIHIAIARHGQALFHQTVRGIRGSLAVGDSHSLKVTDLDGDGEPEVMLVVNWNGTQCCSWSQIYRYDRRRSTYVVQRHMWGNFGAEPVLKDLDGDGRPELRSLDDRFDGVYTNVSGSARPIQIWSYRHGTFRDVTRRFPRLIRRDAAALWRLYRRYPRDARGLLPAWVADEYMLGRTSAAEHALEQAAAQGRLERRDGLEGPRDPQAYIRSLKALLRRTGY